MKISLAILEFCGGRQMFLQLFVRNAQEEGLCRQAKALGPRTNSLMVGTGRVPTCLHSLRSQWMVQLLGAEIADGLPTTRTQRR